MILTIILTLILLLGIFVLYVLIRSENKRKKIYNIKTKEPIPGNSNPFTNTVRFLLIPKNKNFLQLITEYMKKYAPSKFVYSTFLHINQVTIFDVDVVNTVLKDYEKYPKFLPIFGRISTRWTAGENIVFMNGDEWKEIRHHINPIFGKLSIFEKPIVSKVNQLIKIWEDKKTKGTICIGEDIQKMTLDAMGTCLLGRDFDFLGGKEEGPLYSYNYVMKGMEKQRLILTVPFFDRLPLPNIKRIYKEIDKFDEYMKVLIEENHKAKDKKKQFIEFIIGH